jgi:SAM-dependent methyltransferase
VLSIRNEKGTHPKHRLLKYHDFFLDNITANDRVLDIGCGNGELAFDIAKKAREVVAVDIDPKKISVAKSKYIGVNIFYKVADATRDLADEKFDIIMLSNVLEHIDHRVEFLKNIKPLANKFLIRVPMFDRDWIPLYKKELELEWRLDMTHYTEFTEKNFREEISTAGLNIESLYVRFGEIYSVITK